jgi:hypothetical protein
MPVDVTKTTDQDNITLQELTLYHEIMKYRESLGLSPIPLSKALSTTAGRHVEDTRENIWAEDLELPRNANLHSWSDEFYFEDNSAPEAMWEAPDRLGTGYASEGYEISAAGFDSTGQALDGWIASPSHDAVLSNTGVWADAEFLAMGVGVDTSPGAGIYGGRIFHVWFGEAADDEAPQIDGTTANDDVIGTDFDDTIFGLDGDDVLRGGRGDDRLRGEDGEDRISGSSGEDYLYGGSGDDRLFGGGGADRIVGHKGDDRLVGGNGDDRLDGGDGEDRLYGGDGDDILTGDDGRDSCFGGAGADIFVFATPESTGLDDARDMIADFEIGVDRIDLSGIDADLTNFETEAVLSLDDEFSFIKDRAFKEVAGQLRQAENVVEGDIDGDGRADFSFQLRREAVMVEIPTDDPDHPFETVEVMQAPILSSSDFIL